MIKILSISLKKASYRGQSLSLERADYHPAVLISGEGLFRPRMPTVNIILEFDEDGDDETGARWRYAAQEYFSGDTASAAAARLARRRYSAIFSAK